MLTTNLRGASLPYASERLEANVVLLSTISNGVDLHEKGNKKSMSLPRRTTEQQVLGDWEFCSSSAECSNGCCSSQYSDDSKLKCTPLDGGFRPDICLGEDGTYMPTTSSTLLGNWEFCSSSSECSNGCCSSQYSDDGKLKCTPLHGGFLSDICVGGEYSSTPTSQPEPPLIYTLQLSSKADLDSGILETIRHTFDNYYPSMVNYYNPSAARVVEIKIQDEWDGIPGWAIGDVITLRAYHLDQNPKDTAGVTIHELVHVVQNGWQNVPGYLIEGFADFVRDETGIDKAYGNSWSIPDGYQPGQHYTDGYGVTAAFIKWMVRDNRVLLESLVEAFRDGTYSDESTWPAVFGESIDSYWDLYATM